MTSEAALLLKKRLLDRRRQKLRVPSRPTQTRVDVRPTDHPSKLPEESYSAYARERYRGPPDTQPEIKESAKKHEYEIPDSWDAQYRNDKPLDDSDAREETTGLKPGRKPYENRRKARNARLSISLSEQERDAIVKHVEDRNTTVSAWIRKLAFKALGRDIPKRPKTSETKG